MTMIKRYNLENLNGWIQAGESGNSGGGSITPNPNYVMTPGKPPSDITPAVFSIKGKTPYANAYWYDQLGSHPEATRFNLSLSFALPSASDLSACQAVEFELQQSTGALVFNMAWQFNQVGSKTLRIFNYATKVWEDTGIPFALVAGKWTTVYAEFVRNATETWHTGIAINGIWSTIMSAHPGVPTKGAPYLNAAFQLDSVGSNPPPFYRCFVKDYNVSWI